MGEAASKNHTTRGLDPELILSQIAHRPWPLPKTPWFMFQQWTDLLFAHWALDPKIVLPLVPRELELELFDGKAWVSLTPFRMTDIHLRGMPPIPGAGSFLEMNLRTYVRMGRAGSASQQGASGEARSDLPVRPGIFFFSLDASNLPAVVGARLGFGLPYYWSDMSAQCLGGEVHYQSVRRGMRAEVDVRYAPAGSVSATKTELERFLTERYCLYEVRMGVPMRTEIHHLPWPLEPVRAAFKTNTLGDAFHLPLKVKPDQLQFSRQLDVLVYPPGRAMG